MKKITFSSLLIALIIYSCREGEVNKLFLLPILKNGILENTTVAIQSIAHPEKSFFSFYSSEKKELVTPPFDFIKKNDLTIAANEETRAFITFIYHLEKNIFAWEKYFSFTPDKKIPIFLFPSVTSVTKKDKTSAQRLRLHRGNLAFITDPQGFIIYPSNPHNNLSLEVSFAIVAHEYAHYVIHHFLHPWQRHLTDKEQSFLRSLDEGLADFFAFTLASHWNEEINAISLEFKNRELPASFNLNDALSGHTSCHTKFYCLGTILASSLLPTQTTNLLLRARLTLKALEDFSKRKKKDGELSFVEFFKSLIAVAEKSTEKEELSYSFKKWFNYEADIYEN